MAKKQDRIGLSLTWLCAGSLGLCLVGVIGLLLLLGYQGLSGFWPSRVMEVHLKGGGKALGELVRVEPEKKRFQLKIGNRDLYGLDFKWFKDEDVLRREWPEDVVRVERLEHGIFLGRLQAIQTGENKLMGEEAWKFLQDPERQKKEKAVLELVDVEGTPKKIPLEVVLRTIRPNAMGFWSRLGLFFARNLEFLTENPRESNTEGGVFPAIFGTVLMVFLMTLFVTPFGVLAALYLREYSKGGWFVRGVRVAVNNLAGVPSIVFGIFGLGFFVYLVGGSLDSLFFSDRLPSPTFGTGGILWASLTLALLTIPVVIVATEEGLAAVPGLARQGSYALGATKFETMWKVVLPGAAPGILTGVILAIARAAGEVAPLMIVGMVKLAPDLPLDGEFPFIHLERKFMHLGFYIYDLGFQSPNVEASLPMVYATAFLLVVLVTVLNLFAIIVRNRLRRKYATSAV
ncbi:MAG TPA: phosphate ABC transporter permease PstA [Planctomycetes bacterium]|nr:phosphate ABC transporter permease PstA [Planctomycetota bacterium]